MRRPYVLIARETFCERMPHCVDENGDPESRRVPTCDGTSMRQKKRLHVVAELLAEFGRIETQQEPIDAGTHLAFNSRRSRASTTRASSRRASAFASRSPDSVNLK